MRRLDGILAASRQGSVIVAFGVYAAQRGEHVGSFGGKVNRLWNTFGTWSMTRMRGDDAVVCLKKTV